MSNNNDFSVEAMLVRLKQQKAKSAKESPAEKAANLKQQIKSNDLEYDSIDALAKSFYANFDLIYDDTGLSDREKMKIAKKDAKESYDEYHDIYRPYLVNEYYELTGVKLKKAEKK
jgi:hypothetical protein